MGRIRKDLKRRRLGRLVLVIGGASSGKSEFALKIACQGLADGACKAFVATGQPLDAEMDERIRRHREARGVEWRTAEVQIDLAEWFKEHSRDFGAIVLDCLTLWLSNLREKGVPEDEVPGLVSRLLQTIRPNSARVVLVTNELGLGLVPQEAGSRRFRDLAGQVNQQVAAKADEVYLVLSGIPHRIK